MKLTREYIVKNCTACGGWTSAQHKALGITLPPTKGWIDSLEGKEISEEARKLFEDGRFIFAKYTLKRKRREARLAKEQE